jgi:hypothetical protein
VGADGSVSEDRAKIWRWCPDCRDCYFGELGCTNCGPPTLRSVDAFLVNPKPEAPPEVKDTNPKDAAAQDRIPLGLCSPIAKAHWALAQFAGMLKYGAWNWRKAGVRSSVYIHAIQRHLDAYASGEEVDPIDGTHHLGNIMAGCAIILDAKEAGKLTDDRAPRINIRGTYTALQELARELIRKYADKKPRHYTIADSEPEASEILGESRNAESVNRENAGRW